MEAVQDKLKQAAKFYFEPAEQFFHTTIGEILNIFFIIFLSAEPYSYIFDGTEAKLVEDFLAEDPEFRKYCVVGLSCYLKFTLFFLFSIVCNEIA